MAFHSHIRETEQRIAELHARVHETFRLKAQSRKHEPEWKEATRQFHDYRSPIDELMDRCYEEDIGASDKLREFAIDFLECDPMFFRSGYFKELLLDKLKGIALRKPEEQRIKRILIDAIRRRGQREFRRYCRLAACISDGGFLEEIDSLSTHPDSQVRSRAKLMRRYIEERNNAA